jgi:hypothetical protein
MRENERRWERMGQEQSKRGSEWYVLFQSNGREEPAAAV